MGKKITFSFSSAKYEGVEAKETFTFEKLGIDEDMVDDKAFKKRIDEIFQAWVWGKLTFLKVSL
ncbi:MAG: hypothetical protein ABF649_18095 [Bacillus sp. (in: firmicutes)]